MIDRRRSAPARPALSLSLALLLGGAGVPALAAEPSADAAAATTTASAASVSAAEAGAEAEVRRALDAFYAAAEAQDWKALGSMLTDDYRLYTDGAAVFEREVYLDLLRQEDLGVEEMRLDDVQIEVFGDVAWVSFLGWFVHGPTYEVETAETVIFRRVGGDWKMAHSHASVKVVGGDDANGGSGDGS